MPKPKSYNQRGLFRAADILYVQQALATYKETLLLWLRYVDDTFTAAHKDEIDFLHKHLNRQNTYIQFNREIEENGKIPFLDCLVSRYNNKLQTTVYRKPTHTDRLLDQCSYHPTCHKATAVRTLTRRAYLRCFATHATVYRAKPNTYTTSLTKTTTIKTLSPVITTETTDPTRRTPDRKLLRWRQYHTSRVPLKPDRTNPTTTRYLRCSQTDNDLTTATNQRQGQSRTKGQTGSGIQDEMLRLPRNLRWRDGQKPEQRKLGTAHTTVTTHVTVVAAPLVVSCMTNITGYGFWKLYSAFPLFHFA